MPILYSNNQQTYVSGVWNSASSYALVTLDVKDVSSAATSKLLALKVTGSNVLHVDKSGNVLANVVSATTISATNYSNLPLGGYATTGYNVTSLAGTSTFDTTANAVSYFVKGSSVTSLAGTSTFATTTYNATSFAGTSTFETTGYARVNYATTANSWTQIARTTDLGRSANTLAPDDVLTFPVAAGAGYLVNGRVSYYATAPIRNGGIKGGFNFGLSSTANTLFSWYMDLSEKSLGLGVNSLNDTGTGNKDWVAVTQADSDDYAVIHFDCIVDNTGGAAGNFAFRWCPEDNGVTSTIKLGSTLEYRQFK